MTNRVFVPGVPVPQGSTKAFAYIPKAGGKPRARTTSDNPQTMPWRATIAAYTRQVVGPTIVYAEPDIGVLLGAVFVMPRRANEPVRTPALHTRKPDLDKLLRAVMDALSGVLYLRDQQVVGCTELYKRIAAVGESPGLHLSWRRAVLRQPMERLTA